MLNSITKITFEGVLLRKWGGGGGGGGGRGGGGGGGGGGKGVS